MTHDFEEALFGAITSAITDGIGLRPCAERNLAPVRHLLLLVGLPLTLVGLILLIKAVFDALEARRAHGASGKTERQD